MSRQLSTEEKLALLGRVAAGERLVDVAKDADALRKSLYAWWKTLKAEEVDAQAYADLADARARIPTFIEDVDNADRLHPALGYKSPVAFEADVFKAKPPDRTPIIALSPN